MYKTTITGCDRQSQLRLPDSLVGFYRLIQKKLDRIYGAYLTSSPAAADTLARYFRGSGASPEDFDRIVTGDLGAEGSSLFRELTKRAGYDVDSRHGDCGLDIYDIGRQDMHSGGSGCGCSAVVTSAKYLNMLRNKDIRDMLFIGTGALMNAMSVGQGNTIPAVAHLVRITAD